MIPQAVIWFFIAVLPPTETAPPQGITRGFSSKGECMQEQAAMVAQHPRAVISVCSPHPASGPPPPPDPTPEASPAERR